MLKLPNSIIGQRVLSLRAGQPIATVSHPIINPNNLYIEGWEVEDLNSKKTLVLLSNDIREVAQQGLIINDYEVFADKSDLIRLKEILELEFSLIGLKVISESGVNYGKINDYALNIDNFFIQKVYANQPIIKSISNGNLSIDRSQIIEITDKKIVIEDPVDKASIRNPQPA